MMGDEMAVRSGGMYGNPESNYTLATPSSGASGFSPVAFAGKMFRVGASISAAMTQNAYEEKQANLNLAALKKEREYNIENYEQLMADTLASNKLSFYSSGLDLSSGSAMSVMMSNQSALQRDLSMMNYNYEMRERSLENEKKASKDRLKGSIISSVASIF